MQERAKRGDSALLTKQKILACASVCFRERGYLGTTTEEIACRAGVSKAAVYYHYRSKMNLLDQVVSGGVTDLVSGITGIVESGMSPAEKLEAMISWHVEYCLTRHGKQAVGYFERKNLAPALLRKYIGKRDEYEHLFRAVLQEGIACGQFRPADVTVVAAFILGLLNSVPLWFKRRGRLSVREMTCEVRRFVMPALLGGQSHQSHDQLSLRVRDANERKGVVVDMR